MRRFAALMMAFGLCASLATAAEDPKPADAAKPAETSAKAAAGNPRVTLKTTLGDIVIELDAQKAPISTENFVRYAADGHYNGTIFHRVIKDFMIQGGGFNAEMDEKREGLRPGITNEWQNGLKNVRGSIAMARLGGQADSGTAQFFINVVDNAMLDTPRDGAGYAVFGKVVGGMDVVDKIRNTEVGAHPKYPAGPTVPKTPVVIEKATVEGADMEALKANAEKGRTAMNEAKERPMRDLIAKLESDTGKKFVKRDSGLMILMEKEGDGAQPTLESTVSTHYKGTLMDGTQFDSSYDRGSPTEFPLGNVIKGWQEGIAQMKKGGKAHLIIPPDLAYGARGAGGKIGPNATLYFQVELLDVK